jgi:hypothetical protein
MLAVVSHSSLVETVIILSIILICCLIVLALSIRRNIQLTSEITNLEKERKLIETQKNRSSKVRKTLNQACEFKGAKLELIHEILHLQQTNEIAAMREIFKRDKSEE